MMRHEFAAAMDGRGCGCRVRRPIADPDHTEATEDTIALSYDEAASAQCALSVYMEVAPAYDIDDWNLSLRLAAWLDERSA